MTPPAWLALLADFPAGAGEYHADPMNGDPFAGWEQVRLLLGDGETGMRVITAIFDPTGRPGTVSDLVATARGLRQESMSARFDATGSVDGTYWLTEGDRLTPRPLTEGERGGLRDLALALRQESHHRSSRLESNDP